VDIGQSQLARLTAGKAIANTALRWIPFFLPTLAVAFGATTEELTAVLGFGEMAGLCTLLVGRTLDGGGERWIMTGAMLLVATSATLALIGSFLSFAVSFVVLIVGVSLYTVGGHTYISRRVPFERRGRAIGIFETSWASALLIGAPIIALLIGRFGWRGPFVVIAVVALLLSLLVARTPDATPPTADATVQHERQPLTAHAWRLVFASAAIAMAGLTTIVIAGTWLDDRLGVSTGGVGLVAMAFGLAELTSSVSSAVFSDRIGKSSTTRVALGLVLIGAAVMTQAGSSLLVGVVGLLCFFVGFEYAIVTSFAIVSEAMPEARGRALAANNAFGTLARGAGTVASGVLYVRYGISGPVALTSAAAVVALVLLSSGSSRVTPVRPRGQPATP
jgi:predicted MFS family arabinose efflux permease